VYFLGKRKNENYEEDSSKKARLAITEERLLMITAEGPVYPNTANLMLPWVNRNLFIEVINAISQYNKSYVIHEPYQSGKTLFRAIRFELLKLGLHVVFFDTSDLAPILLDKSDEEILTNFTNFMSFCIFQKYMDLTEFIWRLQNLDHKLYLLVDEFQWIFKSQKILELIKNFFRNLSSKPVSYIAVDTLNSWICRTMMDSS